MTPDPLGGLHSANAPRACLAMHRTLNPGNNGFESLAAHANGRGATGRRNGSQCRSMRAQLPPPVPMPDRLTAGRLVLTQPIEVRILVRQPRLCSSSGQSVALVKRSRRFETVQGLPCARTPIWQRGGPRCRMLRVRTPLSPPWRGKPTGVHDHERSVGGSGSTHLALTQETAGSSPARSTALVPTCSGSRSPGRRLPGHLGPIV
jgi:hypothetical protein